MPLFGTTGIRKEFSTYDKEENFFTPSIALRLGLAIGTFIKSGTVVVVEISVLQQFQSN